MTDLKAARRRDRRWKGASLRKPWNQACHDRRDLLVYIDLLEKMAETAVYVVQTRNPCCGMEQLADDLRAVGFDPKENEL